MFLVTSFTAWKVSTPGEVPLTHEQLSTNHLETWVTLVGHHRALNQLRVRCALPAISDFWKLRACVIANYFCRGGEELGQRETVRERQRQIIRK